MFARRAVTGLQHSARDKWSKLEDVSERSSRFREKLGSGEVPLGAMIRYLGMPSVVEMIATAGYDFAILDLQHSAFSLETIGDMCLIGRHVGIDCIVRPPSHDVASVERILEQGAAGVMYPLVQTRSVVDEVRGVLDPNHLLFVQIETREGVANVASIVERGGVDGVQIGRTDLSRSLGVPGEVEHKLVHKAVDAIVSGCAASNVAVGAYSNTRRDTEDLLQRGVRWMICASDSALVRSAFKSSLEAARSALAV
jgi:2-keto-3-deoxy-L-rhamnonate aldolase RhmA